MTCNALRRLVTITFLSAIQTLSCASMNDKWRSAARDNTKEAYEKFAHKYSKSELADEAFRRINDPDYAFLATCAAGTEKAFRGYVQSHPDSRFVPLAHQRLEYFEKTNPADQETVTRFLEECPANPFALEAKASCPLLWLKELGDNIAVYITVDSVVQFKGLFGKKTDEIEALDKTWEQVKGVLCKFGIEAVRISDTLCMSDSLDRFCALITARYSERKVDTRPNQSYYPGGVLMASAAHNLSSLMWTPSAAQLTYFVQRVSSEGIAPRYERILSLERPVPLAGMERFCEIILDLPDTPFSDCPVKVLEILSDLDEDPKRVYTVLTLAGRDLTDPEQQALARDLLKNL